MKIIADTHTHTVASGHAYGTIVENISAAKEKGLRFLASTDHTGVLPGAPSDNYFSCQNNLPDSAEGVYLLRGCEVNLLNSSGALDLPDAILADLEWVIASMHKGSMAVGNSESYTCAWLNVLKNPLVDVLGHMGDEQFKFDYETVVRACKGTGKVIEINSHSFSARAKSDENCREIALLCMKYRVPVVVSSDAHSSYQVGDFDAALSMLEAISFPQDLVLNADFNRFSAFLKKKCSRIFD